MAQRVSGDTVAKPVIRLRRLCQQRATGHFGVTCGAFFFPMDVCPLCTLGTGLKESHIELLRTLPRVAAVPHNDEAGWEAGARWREALPDRLIIPLPDRTGM